VYFAKDVGGNNVVEEIGIFGHGGNNVVSVTAPLATTHVGFTGNGGHDELHLSNVTQGWVNNGWITPAGGKDLWFVPTDLDVIRITGTTGNDTVTVGGPLPNTHVEFSGLGGSDTLRLNNTNWAQVHNGWVHVGGGRDVWFNAGNVEVVSVGGTNGNDDINVSGYLPNTHAAFDGYGGSDVLRVAVGGEAWVNNGWITRPGSRDVWFAAGDVEVVEMNGGGGNDTVNIPWALPNTNVAFNGNGGSDTLRMYNLNTAWLNNGWLTPVGGRDVWFNAAQLERVELHGTNGQDAFHVAPALSATTTIAAYGYGDYDRVIFMAAPPGWTFTSDGFNSRTYYAYGVPQRPIYLSGIEGLVTWY
jgi:hypothetical protein